MIIEKIKVAGEELELSIRVPNEFAEAFARYEFRDFKELNELAFAADRCAAKNFFDWCPLDTKHLKERLGMM